MRTPCRVDADRIESGNAVRLNGQQHLDQQISKSQAGRGSGGGNQKTLEKDLAGYSQSGGAQGRSEGEFSGPGFPASQKKVHHVDTGDQKNKGDRSQQQKKG